MAFDILAIGDTVIDEFIRLKDARVTCEVDDTNCMLCVRFGDKVPFEFTEKVIGVGNSANAAVACARLGLSTSLRVHVGADDNGRLCIEQFKKEGIDTSLVVSEEGKKTNYHFVLWYESERTILIKHESYAYAMPALPEPPKWIYLSSLGEGTIPYQMSIVEYVKKSGVKMAFQPGTFQIKQGAEALRPLYENSEVVFCNKEEAQKILNAKETDIKALLSGMMGLGVKNTVITDGRGGSYAMDEGGNSWHIPMYPDPKPPVDRTGAGDATASTTVAYLIKGMELKEALMRGMINSAYVVQGIGAQKGLLTPERVEELYAAKPADYLATAL